MEKWKFTMQTEQYTPQSFDQPAQRVGTTFEHGNQIDLHASDLARLEAARARADIDAATTQPLEEMVQKRLEYTPLSPQEIVKLIGQKVVFDLRKGYNETHINLFGDDEPSAPYIYNPDQTQIPANEESAKRAEGLAKDDLGLAA
jgi:hypothetical protein